MRTHSEHTQEDLPVVVDCGESRSGLVACLEARWDPVQIRRLPAGDVQVGGVLIERKEAHDFVASLNSGRLFRQAWKLSKAAPRPLLILEGNPYPFTKNRNLLRGGLLSLMTGYRIPVLSTQNVEETAARIAQLAGQERRRKKRIAKKNARLKSRPETTQGDRPSAEALMILESLPGVGETRARALLEQFGSIDAIVRSDPTELLRTPGIGGSTAARILAALLRAVGPAPAVQTSSKQCTQ